MSLPIMNYKFFTNDEANYISEMYKGTNSTRKKEFENEFFDLHYDELLKGCRWEEWINDIIKNPLLGEDELLKCKIGVINQAIYILPIKTDSDLEWNKYQLRKCLNNDEVADNLYINLIIYILYSETYSKIKNMDDFHSFINELSFIMGNDIIRNYIEYMALNKKSVRKEIRNKIVYFLDNYKRDGLSLFEIQNNYFLETYTYIKTINDEGIKKFREDLRERNKEIILKIISNELFKLYDMQDFPLLTTLEEEYNLNAKFDKAYLINRYDYKESNIPPKGYEDLKYINYELKDYYNIANEKSDVFRHKNEFDIVDILSHYYLEIKSYNQQYKFRSFPAYLKNDKEMIAELIISNFKFNINDAFLRVTKKNLPIIDSYFIEEKTVKEENNADINDAIYEEIKKKLNKYISYNGIEKYKKIINYKINSTDFSNIDGRCFLVMKSGIDRDILRFTECFNLTRKEAEKIFKTKDKKPISLNPKDSVSINMLDPSDFEKVLIEVRNEHLNKINPKKFKLI